MTTIAAVATAQGQGAIGIVRISGKLAHQLLSQIFVPRVAEFKDFKPWVMHHGFVLGLDGSRLDDALAVFMPAPRTYTGEDMAEVQCHGSAVILNSVLEHLLAIGATAADHGEFTKRAFLAGRIDLTQAEAVAELISCQSRIGLESNIQRLSGALALAIQNARKQIDSLRAKMILAVDFPDDEIEGINQDDLLAELSILKQSLSKLKSDQTLNRILQNGARVVLAGSVNAGKSSLLNALLGHERALVTDIPGTTRDFLEELCDLDGLAVRLIDTAGLRSQKDIDECDKVELLGIQRSKECASAADCLLIILDGEKWTESMLNVEHCPEASYEELMVSNAHVQQIIVYNKADLHRPNCVKPMWAKDKPFVVISAATGEGFDSLFAALRATIIQSHHITEEQHVSCNLRQEIALSKAINELSLMQTAVLENETYDCLAVRLDMIASLLGEITGESTSAEVLNDIFNRFCIGK